MLAITGINKKYLNWEKKIYILIKVIYKVLERCI